MKIKLITGLLICCMVLLLCTGCTSVNKFRAELHVGQGQHYANLGLFEEAIDQYTLAIEIYPEEQKAYYMRASIYTFMEEYELADADAQSLQAINPRNPNVFGIYALACIGTEQYDKVIENASIAIKLAKDWAHPWAIRGYAYEKLGEYRLAVEDTSQSIILDPTYPQAYNTRGLSYVSLGEYEKALPDFSKAIELNEYFIEAYFNRGKLYRELGMKPEAIADFEKFISLSNDQARMDLVRQYIEELSD